VNATVTALPGCSRLVSVAGIGRTARMRNLAWLASQVISAPGTWPVAIIADQLALYADPGRTPAQQMEHWLEYVRARHEELQALDGCVVWQDLSDEEGPQGHHMSAVEIAGSNAALALADLAGRDI
jgi:hypothetical protein